MLYHKKVTIMVCKGEGIMIDKTMDMLRIKQTAILQTQRKFDLVNKYNLWDVIFRADKLGKERGLTTIEVINEALDLIADDFNIDL